FKQCCELLLQQMSFINSKTQIESVNNGFKMALNHLETTKIFIAKSEENNIVGIAYANKGTSIEKAGYYLWINELHVNIKYRRKGIASGLLVFIIDWCKQENIRGISFISDIDNEIAADFYHKHGFDAEDVLFFNRVFELNE